jgi:hypothetical protein
MMMIGARPDVSGSVGDRVCNDLTRHGPLAPVANGREHLITHDVSDLTQAREGRAITTLDVSSSFFGRPTATTSPETS